MQTQIAFNEEVLALRHKKMDLIEQMKLSAVQLERLQASIRPNQCVRMPPIPVLHPDEIPEQ